MSEIIVKEAGCNPAVDGASDVQRIDMSKGFLPRLRRIWSSEAEPVTRPPAPPIDPVVELQQKRELLAHLKSQLSALQARTEGKSPAQTTAIQAAADVQRRYAKQLTDLEDVASAELCDIALLEGLLNRPGEGLILVTQSRVTQLESQTTPPASPSDEHRRLIAADEKAFRAWGKARNARRKYEDKHVPTAIRHEYQTPRAGFGVDFGRVDSNTIQRVANMACVMPEGK